MWSQVGLRKHHYEQSEWRWWNSSWAVSNPERWCCETVPFRPANLEDSAVAIGLEKVSFHSNPKERKCQKCLNYRTIACISHASKVVLKILQPRLQQYVNHELPDVQAGFRKRQRNQRLNCQRPLDHRKSKSFKKTSTSALLTMPKPLTVWIMRNCWNFWKRWEYQTTWTASSKICMQVR